MERRRADRVKTRVPCELHIAGRRHSGIVLNVSPVGLFAQTVAQPALGTGVDVRLRLREQNDGLALRATVASKRVVPSRLVPLAQGGLGLSIEYAPEAYYEYLLSVSPDGSTTPRQS